MDTTMEDALLQLNDSIRNIGVIRAEMEKMQKEVDKKKKEFEKMNEKLNINRDDVTKRKDDLMKTEEELQIALDELMKTNEKMVKLQKEEETLKKEEETLKKEIVKFQASMEKLQREMEKMQREMEKMQLGSIKKTFGSTKKTVGPMKKTVGPMKKTVGPMKKTDTNVNETMAIEKLRKEIEEIQAKLSSKRNEIQKLQKDMEILTKDKETSAEEQNKAMEDLSKKREERSTKKMEIEDMKNKDTEEKEKEFEHIEKETDKKRSELVELLHGFKALKIWQYGFIDDQIKPRLESDLKEIGSSDRISDTLDDLRLLVLDERARGGCNEMLSVYQLCSDPIVKIISAKMLIQTAFMDKAKVLNLDKLDKDKSATIWENSDVSKIRGVCLESAVLEGFNFPSMCPELATTYVKITGDAESLSSVHYQAVSMSEKKCEMISAEVQDGYVKFPLPPRMKHLFIIAKGKWKQDILTPEGLDLTCDDVENITIRCPPGSVKTTCIIRTQVMYPNPVENTNCEDPNDDTTIDFVSPSLCIKLDGTNKFQKTVTATLPGPSTPSNTKNTKLCLVDITDDDAIHISTVISGTQQYCEFEVEHPTRHVIVRFKGPIQSNDNRWKSYVQSHFPSIPRKCKIVVFSALYVENTIWVEIVQSQSVQCLKESRDKLSLAHLKNAESKLISLRYGDAITVRAQTGIRIPQGYNGEYMEIKYTDNEDDNNLTFGVEIMDEATSAELAFWLKGTQVYVCRFNTKDLLSQRSGTTNSMLTDDDHDLAIFMKSKTLSSKSLSVLAYHIPVNDVVFLALGLGLSINDVDHIKATVNAGRELTLRVLITWRDKHIKDDFDEMISELAEALEGILKKLLASALREASKMKRCLNRKDIEE